MSIHANVNICQAKDNFCKAIESNEKNDRFVTHPVNDSSQPKPSGPNQANEENRSSISSTKCQNLKDIFVRSCGKATKEFLILDNLVHYSKMVLLCC